MFCRRRSQSALMNQIKADVLRSTPVRTLENPDTGALGCGDRRLWRRLYDSILEPVDRLTAQKQEFIPEPPGHLDYQPYAGLVGTALSRRGFVYIIFTEGTASEHSQASLREINNRNDSRLITF